MTPDKDCPSDGASIPRTCSEAFTDTQVRLARIEERVPHDLPVRIGGIEATLREVRDHQKSVMRRAYELTKAAAVFVIGAIVGAFK